MKKKLIFVVIALTSAGYTAHAATEVARVNGTSISLEEFNSKYRESLKFFQFKVPTKRGVLDDLIKRELGIQEAKREGLERNPEVQDLMNTVLYHALLDKKLSKEFETIKVTDGEAKDYYKRNPEIRTSHIFIALRGDAKPDDVQKARARIEEIQRDYLRDGKMSFADVAQHYSEGIAAPAGGDIDYQTRDKLDPAYYEAALKLGIGKVSPIVRSQFGFHIIKLTGIRMWEEVDKNAVKRMVFDEKRSQIFDKYMAQLRSKAKVTVHSELLKD